MYTHIHAHIHIHSSNLVPKPPQEKRSTHGPNTAHHGSHTNGDEGGGHIHKSPGPGAREKILTFNHSHLTLHTLVYVNL